MFLLQNRATQRSNCYHKYGHDAPCEFDDDTFPMVLFGVAQVFISQIPDFHSMGWLSVVAAMMSFAYSFIGLGLGAAKVIGIHLFSDYSFFVLILHHLLESLFRVR